MIVTDYGLLFFCVSFSTAAVLCSEKFTGIVNQRPRECFRSTPSVAFITQI